MSDVVRLSLGDAMSHVLSRRGKSPVLADRGVRLVSAVNVKDGRIQDLNERFVPEDLYDSWMPEKLRPGDVLLTSEAPLGEVAYISNDEPLCIGQRLFALRGRADLVHGRFLYYLLMAGPPHEEIQSRATGTTVGGIRLSELLKVSLELPPLAEQRVIAAVLGALDDKIESNRRLSRLAQDLARTELEDACSDASRIVPVGELVCSVQERRKSVDPDVRYVGLEHFTGFDLSLWRSGQASETKSASKICSVGDLLFGRIRPYFGNVCLAPGDAVVAQSVEVLRAAQPENRESVFLRLSSREFIEQATLLSSGTTMPQVKWHDLQKEQVVVPSETRSVEFRKRVAPLFEVIARAPREVEALIALRDALLPELLSGRIRASDAEKVVEGAV